LEKAGSAFLGSLRVEPEMVLKGDVGSTDIPDKDALPITNVFNEMVDTVLELTENGGRRFKINDANRPFDDRTSAYRTDDRPHGKSVAKCGERKTGECPVH
jgi:hypothetical protein